MNYFEHHIGDYAEATSHLSFVEDAAYSRCIRKYYATEKALPADAKAVQRLVGARSKEEKEAVVTVLEEFFELRDDGWHNERCDAEIARYLAGEPEREAKKANEESRLKRHRDERAALFQVLSNAGQHAAWNIGIKELRDIAKTLQANHPQPLPATAPATPATATQSPIPSTCINTPIPPDGGVSSRKRSAISFPTFVAECKAAGVKPIPDDDGVFRYAEQAGIPHDFLRLQWLEFKDRYSLPGAKRYKAWPTVFGKSVRGNWFKLWYATNEGTYALTTTGIQADNAHKEIA